MTRCHVAVAALLGLSCLAAPLFASDAEATGPWADHELPEGWYAAIDTSMGDILVRLHPEQAPQGVAHVASLAEGRLEWTDVVTGETRHNRYYDGIPVYRADAGRMFETGDPHGLGDQSPRILVPPEVGKPVNFSGGYKMGLTRAPLGQISGAKFFITVAAEPRLNSRHPCIGTVIEGKEVVYQITSVKTYPNGRPIEPVTIESVRIFKRGTPDPLEEPRPYTPTPQHMQLREDPSRRR